MRRERRRGARATPDQPERVPKASATASAFLASGPRARLFKMKYCSEMRTVETLGRLSVTKISENHRKSVSDSVPWSENAIVKEEWYLQLHNRWSALRSPLTPLLRATTASVR
eukprot:3243892-Rhodomonas_salina.1